MFDRDFFDIFICLKFDHLRLQILDLCLHCTRDIITGQIVGGHDVEVLYSFEKKLFFASFDDWRQRIRWFKFRDLRLLGF